MPTIPHAPPQWARGDVGREIGKWILAEVKSALALAGINGRHIDAGHLVGVMPPAVGGLPEEAEGELIDDAGVVLTDDLADVLVIPCAFAPARHQHTSGS